MQMFIKLKNILKQKDKTKKIEVKKTFFLICAIQYSLYFYIFIFLLEIYFFFLKKNNKESCTD